jgi:rhamnulokinase
MPGQVVAPLKKEIAEKVGFQTKVVLVPTHDTASALMAIGTEKPDTMLISSGTWSLVGMETDHSVCTTESLNKAFTNEGGYNGIVDYLKNSMGLWIIQCIQKEMAPEISFTELCDLAERENIDSVVDANDARFLGPENMSREIIDALEMSGQQIPETVGQMAKVVYHSLAVSYGVIVKELEEIRKKPIRQINILGGGSKADYLNRLTRQITGKTVYAGPGEATALGNLMCQMITDGVIKNQDEGRRIVRESFDVKIYE